MGFATDMEVWEPSLNRWKDGKWVAAKLDLRIENFALKLAVFPTVVDVSVVHVTSPSYLLKLRHGQWSGKTENLTVVDMMAFREQSKHGEYQLRDTSGRRRTALRLIPFVVNEYGSWGDSAVLFLKRACMFSGKRGKFVVDQVSLAIARNIARRLRLALGAVTWDRPGLPVTLFEQTSQEQRPTPSSDPDGFAPAPAGRARNGAVDRSPAVGDEPAMSAPVDGSVSSTSVAQRTTFWQAQGDAKGAPPPGNHRGPGALPAAGQSSPSVASFMNKGKSVLEAKGAKRALLEQAAGSIGSAGKGPIDSALTLATATGALATGIRSVEAEEVGQHDSAVTLEIATGALAPGIRGVAAAEVGQQFFMREGESFPGEQASASGRVDPSSPGRHVFERGREESEGPISPGQHAVERECGREFSFPPGPISPAQPFSERKSGREDPNSPRDLVLARASSPPR